MDVENINESKHTHRLFLGGLPDDVTQADLERRFSHFGIIQGIDIITEKQSIRSILDKKASGRGFAFIDLHTKNINKVISRFRGSKWRGKIFRIEIAKVDGRLVWEKRRSEWKKEDQQHKKQKNITFQQLIL